MLPARYRLLFRNQTGSVAWFGKGNNKFDIRWLVASFGCGRNCASVLIERLDIDGQATTLRERFYGMYELIQQVFTILRFTKHCSICTIDNCVGDRQIFRLRVVFCHCFKHGSGWQQLYQQRLLFVIIIFGKLEPFRMVLRYPCHHERSWCRQLFDISSMLSILWFFNLVTVNVTITSFSTDSTNFLYIFCSTYEWIAIKLRHCSGPDGYQRYRSAEVLKVGMFTPFCLAILPSFSSINSEFTFSASCLQHEDQGLPNKSLNLFTSFYIVKKRQGPRGLRSSR